MLYCEIKKQPVSNICKDNFVLQILRTLSNLPIKCRWKRIGLKRKVQALIHISKRNIENRKKFLPQKIR